MGEVLRKVALRAHALLPGQYDERKVLATTVDAGGRALWLLCPDADAETDGFGRVSVRPRTLPFEALLVVVDRGVAREQVLPRVGLSVHHLDALPNGRLLLEGRGAGAGRTAEIRGRDGRLKHAFDLGRGVEFLMADRRHHLWSAYGDEGVYGDPVAVDGLVRWDSGGNRRWGYTAPAGFPYIDTVYAFNVDDGVARACYYPAFPLLEARADGRTTVRRSPVVAPRGLAVHGGEAVLLGGDRQHDLLHRCRLTDREVRPVERARLTYPNGDPLGHYARPVGRGPLLYLRGRTPRQWYVLDVRTAVLPVTGR
ncbi:hypothetical protein ACIQBJ_32765 [Kitasatospora sp. NPDC088391]|uniref:hypothetical protein n=1 Tax=Kitasatospora sp. NPDC088391 TaxID=3364074 RepID=UPI0037F35E1C